MANENNSLISPRGESVNIEILVPCICVPGEHASHERWGFLGATIRNKQLATTPLSLWFSRVDYSTYKSSMS